MLDDLDHPRECLHNRYAVLGGRGFALGNEPVDNAFVGDGNDVFVVVGGGFIENHGAAVATGGVGGGACAGLVGACP